MINSLLILNRLSNVRYGSRLCYYNQLSNKIFTSTAVSSLNVGSSVRSNQPTELPNRLTLTPKSILFQTGKSTNMNVLVQFYSTANGSQQENPPKKASKFKQLYTQYGPLFLVVHLTTVVLWIYFFFLISKQGYDITQLLNLFERASIMSKETVDSIHHRIDNYKMESGWLTGPDLKHFATAYMIYKVIAPFRYVVSIGIVRSLVQLLRNKGLMKKH